MPLSMEQSVVDTNRINMAPGGMGVTSGGNTTVVSGAGMMSISGIDPPTNGGVQTGREFGQYCPHLMHSQNSMIASAPATVFECGH